MTIKKLEDLEVWQDGRLLCKGIYILTKNYPKSEEYNIKKHLRESVRGFCANVAEGFGRYFYKESLRFYGIARGCLEEVKSDIYISYDVGYISKEILDKYLQQINKIEAKTNALIASTMNRVKEQS